MRLLGFKLAEQVTSIASAANSNNDAVNAIVALIIVALVLGAYFIPFIIALLRGHT